MQPTSTREGFTARPDVAWEDIGGLEANREELKLAIVDPILKPEIYEKIGLKDPMGVLLYGPPGCGKTLLAKAVANATGSNFISIKGPEILNKYLGESEKAIAKIFERAKTSSPCVVFFDEFDSIVKKRGSDDNAAVERCVNALLTEMDGVKGRKKVFVIAATNRPDMIDPAIMRPGRLDKLIYIPLPGEKDRLSILQTIVRKVPIGVVDLELISKQTLRFTGADLAGLLKEAQLNCVRRVENGEQATIEMIDFELALIKMKPSVSQEEVSRFDRMQHELRTSEF